MEYSVKEASSISGLSLRMIQYYCRRDNISKKGRSYIITHKQLLEWSPDVTLTKVDETQTKVNEELIEETFTVQQYDKLQDVIADYPLQKKDIEYLTEKVEDYRLQIEYLKRSLDKRDDTMQSLLDHLQTTTRNIEQRTYIEAKEKNIK
jgi:DNA-binding transcriptional MerR regulator